MLLCLHHETKLLKNKIFEHTRALLFGTYTLLWRHRTLWAVKLDAEVGVPTIISARRCRRISSSGQNFFSSHPSVGSRGMESCFLVRGIFRDEKGVRFIRRLNTKILPTTPALLHFCEGDGLSIRTGQKPFSVGTRERSKLYQKEYRN